jgi:hypothetical protein
MLEAEKCHNDSYDDAGAPGMEVKEDEREGGRGGGKMG